MRKYLPWGGTASAGGGLTGQGESPTRGKTSTGVRRAQQGEEEMEADMGARLLTTVKGTKEHTERMRKNPGALKTPLPNSFLRSGLCDHPVLLHCPHLNPESGLCHCMTRDTQQNFPGPCLFLGTHARAQPPRLEEAPATCRSHVWVSISAKSPSQEPQLTASSNHQIDKWSGEGNGPVVYESLSVPSHAQPLRRLS